MPLLDGLYPYEVLLAGAGILLFVVVLFLFVRQVLAQKPYGGLLMFYFLSVVMIGWPSIQKVQIGEDSVSLEKNTTALQQNPKDAKLRETVASQVRKMSGRPITDPGIATRIATAQLELGDPAASEATVDKVLAAAPKAAGPLEVKNRILLNKRLKDLTAKVEADPGNATAKTELKEVASSAAKVATANPDFVNTAAAAELAIGNMAKAAELNSKALVIDPNRTGAIQLRQRIVLAKEQSAKGSK